MTRGCLRASANENRFILRAELRDGADVAISYAYDVTPRSAFVATDLTPDLGTQLTLRLSFPQLLDPVELAATVAEYCAPDGPGAPAGLLLTFAPHPQLTAVVEQASTPGVAVQACRILLVEDNDFIRDIFEYGIRAFFEARGAYYVDHATSAEAAWERLEAGYYDIAIVDYFLPAANGASLIARIREDNRFASLPIVAVSVGGRDARDATLAAGADLFLDKPVVFRDLFNTLRVHTQMRASDGAAHRKTILVFDDSPMVLAMTRSALELAGFEVAVAENLETFEHHRGALDPDLILVDVQMPEAFGDDVVLTLREGHGVRVPILLVSSLDEGELATRAERARAAGYIQKAAGMTELVRRCKELLGAAA